MVVPKYINLLRMVFRLSVLFYKILVHLDIKFFVPLLAPLTSNEYTIKDSFSFSEELLTFDSNLVMASFDIESLFTNVPLKETIDVCVDILFSNTTNIDGIKKDYFHELLNICMSESLVLLDG